MLCISWATPTPFLSLIYSNYCTDTKKTFSTMHKNTVRFIDYFFISRHSAYTTSFTTFKILMLLLYLQVH